MSAVPPLMPGVGAWAHPRRAMHNAGRGQRGLLHRCMQRTAASLLKGMCQGAQQPTPGWRAGSPAGCCPGGPPGAPPACTREAACREADKKDMLQGC